MLYKTVDLETLNDPITKVLIDTDSIVYAIAFSMQETNEEGEVVLRPRIKDTFATIRGRCQDFVHGILDQLGGVEDYELYIGGTGNFRISVATIKPYKGQRPPKPILHEDIKQYFIKFMGAIEIHGIEVDDKLAIEQTQYLKEGVVSVVASLDKDLLQVPGYHYKWQMKRKIKGVDKIYPGELRYVSVANGLKNLYMQALTGDVADNIPGVKGIGDVKALKLIKEYTEERQMYMVCWEQWFDYILKKGLTKKVRRENELETDEDIAATLAFDYLDEVLELLYLRRHQDDRWTAP